MAKQLNVDMRFTADTSQVESSLSALSADLKKIASTPQVLFDDTSIKNASSAALELQRHLQAATDVNTGKLDLSRFSASLSASGKDLNYFKTNLLAIGEDGQQAFLHLAQSIATAEAPTTRVNKKLMEMGTVLKNTVRWQISSSIIHGFMGAVQQAWGYAQDLNESLNNIRIVTGHNTEEMAAFAKQANDAAKALHTTTTEYTDASLIYYQQGLSDKEVQERTDVTIKLANVSRQSAEDVSDQMTAIWNNFYDGSESLEYYADVITNLGAHTASSSSEIAQGIQKFAAVAHTTGLSYEYATSALATLVATTRESADVVGTSLKTLFARIQGLKLGETLEDGVDLNKYSKALDAVGVSIMDQAGNLRNMDDILDDIGAKWDTLNRTQQTALAQTVAGVRQYNQFVALMDNWDFMKENLEIAEQATGTLQNQADIYAESWEAARDKVKASAEGIYQALINDNAIIKMTNGLADALEGVEGLTNGLGGMNGILSLIGSIFMTRFAKEIPSVIQDITANINVFTGKAASDMQKLQSENIALLDSFKGLSKTNTLSFDTQIDGLSKVAKMTHSLTAAQNQMSDAEKAAYQQKIQNVQATYQMVQALAEEAEALQKKAEAEEKSMVSSGAQSVMNMYQQYNEAMDNVSNLEQRLNADPNNGRLADQLEKARQKANELEAALDEVQRVLKLENYEIDQLSNKDPNKNSIRNYQLLQSTITTVTTKLKDQINSYTRLDTAVSNIKSQAQVWESQSKEISESATKTEELRSNMSGYLELIEQTAKSNNFGFQIDTTKLKELQQLLGDSSSNVEDIIQKFTEFSRSTEALNGQKLDELDTKIVQLQNDLLKLGGSSPAQWEQFRDSAAKAAEGLLKFESGARNAGRAADELAGHTVQLSEVIGQLSSSLMSINAMINSLSRISDVFNDKDASAIEKFGAVIGVVTTALMAYKAISTLAAKATLYFTGTQAGAAAGAAATGAAASGAAGGVAALNAALSSGPVIIFTAAIMALAGAFVFAEKRVEKMRKAAEEATDKAREAADQAKEEANATRDAAQEYDDAAAAYERAKESYIKGTISAEELKTAQDNLAEAAGVASTAMDLQGVSVAKLTGNYDQLTDAVRQAYKEEIELAKRQEENVAKLAKVQLGTEMNSWAEGSTYDRTYDISNSDMFGNQDNAEILSIITEQLNNQSHEFLSLVQTNMDSWTGSSTTALSMMVEDFRDRPDEFLQAYEELQTLYQHLQDTLTADQLAANRGLLASMEETLKSGSEAYQTYKSAMEAIATYEEELLFIQNSTEEHAIDSVEKYNEYRQSLIDQLAEQRHIAEDDEEGMALVAAAVDKYLGNKSYLEPFQEIADSMRDIAKATGIAEEAIKAFYDTLNDEQKANFGAAQFNAGTNEEDWLRQINRATRQSQIQNLSGQQAVANEGAAMFDNKKTTAADIREWARGFDFESMAETMHLGEFSLSDFLMLTDDEKQAILQSYAQTLELIQATEKAAEIERMQEELAIAEQKRVALEEQDAIEAQHKAELLREYLDLITRNNGELTEAEQARVDQLLTSLARMYQDSYEDIDDARRSIQNSDAENLAAEAAAQEALAGGYASIKAEIEELQATTEAYTQDLEYLAMSASSLAELNSMQLDHEHYAMGLMNLANSYESCSEEAALFSQAMRGNNEELKKTAEEALRASIYAAELGESCDIAADEIENYAAALKDSGKFANATEKAFVEMAKDQARFDRAVESSIKNYNDWIEDLKIGAQTGVVAAETMKELRAAYGDLLDIDGSSLSNTFLKSAKNLELMRQAMEGSEEAYQQLQQLAGQEILAHIGLDTSQYFTDLNTVISTAEQCTNQKWADIEAGASLNDEGFLQALTDIVNAAGMTAQQATDYLSSMGVDAEVVEQTQTQPTQSIYTGATAHFATHTVRGYDPLSQTERDYTAPSIWYTPNTTVVPGQEQITGFGLKVISANKSSGGSVKAGGSAPLAGNGGHATPQKTGGGGGGGSKEKEIQHADKKSDSEKERYHTLKNQLEDLSAAYDRVSKAADRAFGKDKLKLIDGEIQATDDLIQKQKEYIDAIQKNLPTDKAIMEAYAQKLLGFGISYDESGNIANYDALQDAMWAVYNARADAMDSSSTEWQVFEKEFKELEHWIEQYEETYDLLRDEQDKLQEYVDQQTDLQLKKIQYAIELKLNVADDSLAVLNYQLDRLEDKAFSAAEAIALMGSKVDVLYDKVAADREGLDKVLGQQLSSAEIQRIYEGDMSVLNDKHFTEDQIAAIKEYRDDLLALNEELLEVRENVQAKVMDTFDEFNEKLEDQIDLFDHYNAILENYKNIIDIVGRSYLKVDKELMKTLNQATINNAINKVKGTKDAYDALVLSQAEAEKALQEAIARGNEIDIEAWEKDLEEIQKKVNDAQENMMQAWEDALQSCAEMFEMAVEDAIDNFNKAMLPFGSLEEFQDAYDKQKEVADQYLEDYDKIYELSKLARNVNNSINDAPNIAGKQKLAKLLEKINKYQEDGVEMSKYDLEYLQKEYDLRLAEIALEEAQNAKSVVRLTRDNEGNYSYSYTADSSAVDDAAQKYEDALHAMQELSSNYIDEMSDQLIDATQKMEEELAAVRVEDYASIEDYYKKIDEIQQYWLDRMGYMQNEFQKALDNNKTLYEQDWQRYADATGYKISADEDFAKSYQDTVLGKLFDSEDDIIDFQQRVNDALGDSDKGLIGELLAAYIQWQENTEHAMEAAGTSSEGFAEHMEEAVSGPGGIVDQSQAATESVENMATQMIAGFTSVIGAVDQWQNHYSDTMDAIIAKNMAVIEAHNLLVKALSTGDSTTSTSGSSSSSGSSSNSSGSSGASNSGSGSSGSGSNGVAGSTGGNSELTVGSYVDVKSGTKWYADSWGGAPWGWARSGTIQYTADGNPLAYNIEGLGWIRKSDIVGYGSGGYTGEWGPAGKLAMLHEKEVVLNAEDSANFLSAIEMVRDFSRYIDLQAQWQSTGLGALVASAIKETDNTLQQQVSITADFPNVSDRNEIEAAFNSLVNTAAQYANRKNPLSGIV